jgi:aromatic ring-opening dioxygenase catalytic subunit (LigB family)
VLIGRFECKFKVRISTNDLSTSHFILIVGNMSEILALLEATSDDEYEEDEEFEEELQEYMKKQEDEQSTVDLSAFIINNETNETRVRKKKKKQKKPLQPRIQIVNDNSTKLKSDDVTIDG